MRQTVLKIMPEFIHKKIEIYYEMWKRLNTAVIVGLVFKWIRSTVVIDFHNNAPSGDRIFWDFQQKSILWESSVLKLDIESLDTFIRI
jgi:hypothetical protein